MSGKTRLAAEALRAVAQDKDDLEVLLLNDGASPLSFLEHGVPSDGVVWLDDLEGFLACRVDCRARAAAAGRRERHRGHHARS